MHRSGRGGASRPQGGGARPHSREERDETPSISVDDVVFGASVAPTLYSDIAEAKARAVSPGQRGTKNKPTQLRRFYDELVMLQEKVGGSDERFKQHEPFVQMLKAKVAYARGREKIDANFEHLLRRVIDQSKDAATLRQAKLFMEAFMAFYKVHGPQERG